MIQQQLPHQLRYQRIVPKSFPSTFKQWRIDPMSSNKFWAPNDIVRFNFLNNSRGVFDTMRSYIQITVSCSETTTPIGLLQIDNSAQSFFQQMVLYSKGKQVQRITQYGVIAAYLNDIGLSQIVAQGRQIQGLGYGDFNTMPYQKAIPQAIQCIRKTSGDTCYQWSSGTHFPTIPNNFLHCQDSVHSSLIIGSRACKGHVTSFNSVLAGQQQIGGSWFAGTRLWAYQAQQWGMYNNIRAQYQTTYVKNNYIQTPKSIPCYELLLDGTVFNITDTTVNVIPAPKNTNGNTVYSTHIRNTTREILNFNHQKSDQKRHAITSANYGFSSLYSPGFSRGLFQPFISPTVRQQMMKQGKFLDMKQPVTTRKFKVPILSGVMGILIDPSQYMLLPLQGIKQCLMELTLDPYAMFTSGYKDISQLDDVGMGMQQQRNFTIQRIQYKIHTYHYQNQEITNYIRNSLYRGISFVSNFWTLSNQFQIPGKNGPNNNYIVGCGSKNLNQIVCLFYPNDHQKYSFCRKHYRLSNNISRFYTKLGVQYWPPQPFKGNGGNITSDKIDDDNSIYVQNIYWANNFMFSSVTPLPRINIYNFAPNQRPYDPSNRSTFYDPDMKANHQYQFGTTSVNADTAMGMAWIHQNRCVGKAAYVISFTPYSEQQNIVRGIDVSGLSNFQVIFQSDNNQTFPRDQTLYIVTSSSVLVTFDGNGISTYGR